MTYGPMKTQTIKSRELQNLLPSKGFQNATQNNQSQEANENLNHLYDSNRRSTRPTKERTLRFPANIIFDLKFGDQSIHFNLYASDNFIRYVRAPWHAVWTTPLKMTFFGKVGDDVINYWVHLNKIWKYAV